MALNKVSPLLKRISEINSDKNFHLRGHELSHAIVKLGINCYEESDSA